MVEHDWTFCDKSQYYSLAKPGYLLHATADERHVEKMLQMSLLYGLGVASHAELKPFLPLFRAYRPLIERLNRRRWIFDAHPFA